MINMVDQPSYITQAQYNAITKWIPGVDREKLKMLGRNVAKRIIWESYGRRGWSLAARGEWEQGIIKLVEEIK